MTKRKLIIDTDAGIDDSQAILMALNCPDVDVVAITTCHGNVDVEQINLNVLRVLKVADRLDIPVYGGCNKSLIGDRKTASHYHGEDGLGDVPDPEAPGSGYIQKEHAVMALIRLINTYPGEVSLVCLAPLTNLALAMRIQPGLSTKLQHCFIMGGNYYGEGNVTHSAEFNFHTDPEAAHVVLNHVTCPLTLVCWELCKKTAFTWSWYEAFVSHPSLRGRFIRRLESKVMSEYYSEGNDDGCTLYTTADQLVMACCLLPQVVQDSAICQLTVCLDGRTTRGQLVRVRHAPPGPAGEALQTQQRCEVIQEVDHEVYGQLLMGVVMDQVDFSKVWKALRGKT